MLELNQLSKIGFGTYRVDGSNPIYIDAMENAHKLGCNLIDTAPNYRNENSELMIVKSLIKAS